jgi:glucose/arabinose dehydrogenase
MHRSNGLPGRHALALAAAILALSPRPAAAADAVAVEIGNFANPTHVAVAPGRPGLLFVVERAGRIRVLRNEQARPQPFLDIANLVLGPPDPGAGGEQGLLSVAFSPDYAQSRRFYVAFNNRTGDVELAEFRRSAASPLLADRASRRTLLRIRHREAQNHNGGQLQFGPEGLLYISVGDGGQQTPTGENARRLNNLLGKILRIRPRPANGRPYGIPNSNPFVGRPGRDEIFAYGLRNPWRFSFDGGRIAIADVGQTRREEVNILRRRDASGVNFGWPQYEGNLEFDDDRPGPHPATPPIFTYGHGCCRCSIVGGYVVRDQNLPRLLGRYLYGDFCTGKLRSFIPRVGSQQALRDRAVGVTLPQLSSFGQGFNGKIYAAQLNGRVSRLEPP